MPELTENRRKQLDQIVGRMVSNHEPEENIRFVVEDFKTKYAPPAAARAPVPPGLQGSPRTPQDEYLDPGIFGGGNAEGLRQEGDRMIGHASEAAQGAADVVTGGGNGRAGGASRVIRNLGAIAAPYLAAGTGAAPATIPAAAISAATGVGAQAVAEPALNMIGVSPEGSALGGDIAGILAGGRVLRNRMAPPVEAPATQSKVPALLLQKLVERIPGVKAAKDTHEVLGQILDELRLKQAPPEVAPAIQPAPPAPAAAAPAAPARNISKLQQMYDQAQAEFQARKAARQTPPAAPVEQTHQPLSVEDKLVGLDPKIAEAIRLRRSGQRAPVPPEATPGYRPPPGPPPPAGTKSRKGVVPKPDKAGGVEQVPPSKQAPPVEPDLGAPLAQETEAEAAARMRRQNASFWGMEQVRDNPQASRTFAPPEGFPRNADMRVADHLRGMEISLREASKHAANDPWWGQMAEAAGVEPAKVMKTRVMDAMRRAKVTQ